MLLEGIFAAVTTPFEANESLYLRKLELNIEHYSRTPISGLVVLGSTGEASMLSDMETREVLRITADVAAPEKVLLAGVGRESVRETVGLAEFAAKSNYDAVLVRTPNYYAPFYGDLARLNYFRAVADRSPLPVVLYTIPKFAHYLLETGLIAELAQHPNIIGLKDSSGSIERITEVVKATAAAPRRIVTVTNVFEAVTGRMKTAPVENFVLADALISGSKGASAASTDAGPIRTAMRTRTKETGFQVLTGSPETLVGSLEAGASGGVLGFAACAPQACQEIYTAWKERDRALALEKQARLVSACCYVAGELGIPGIKYAADWNGYYGGRARLPLLPLTTDEQKKVELLMADLRS